MLDDQHRDALAPAHTESNGSGPSRAPLAPDHAGALQEVTEYLEAILNAIADPVFVKDETLRFVLVNDSLCDILGHRREDILGKRDEDFFPAQETAVFRAKDQEVLATGEPNVNQETLTDANGERHVLSTKKSRFCSRSGKRFIVGIIRDVTVQVRNEAALARQAELLELTSDAVIVRDQATNRIVFWNLGAERKYGWTRQEALGRDAHALLQTRFPEPLAAVQRTLDQTGSWEGTVHHTARDGHPIIVSSRWALQRDEGGQGGVILEISRDITRQKRAEQSLIEQERKFRAVFERAGIGIALMREEGVIMEANPYLARMMDMPVAELVGRSFAEFTLPEDLPLNLQLHREVFQGERDTYQMEKRYRRSDGTIVWGRLTVSLVRDEQDRPSFGIAMIEDISEQKRAEHELVEQRNFVEGLVQNLPIGVAYTTSDLIYEWVNPLYARAVGRTPEEFIGRAVFDVFPGTESQLEAMLIEVVRTGRPFSASSWGFTFTDAQGVHETFWDMAVTPVFEERRRVKGLLISASEVTPRVRLEREVAQRNEELERERSFIKRLVDNAPAAIAYVNRELTFQAVNPEYARMVDIPMERILFHPIDEVFGAMGAAQIRPMMRQVLETGEPFHGTSFPFTYVVAGQQRLTYWDFTYQPVFGPRHEVEAVLILASEVSARVERERLQQELIRHLREIDTMKDEFISILSHELRTPINAITGFGSILNDEIAGPLTEQQHTYLGKMLAGADTLLNLVNDLLDMSRIQAGKFRLNPARMEVAPVLAGVLEAIAPLAEKKHLTLLNEGATGLPEIVADEQRVRQVLVNLVGNAIKFTPDGGTIRVRARQDDEGIRCEVEDTGIGLTQAEIGKLFKPFSQVDMSATRQAGGTGLGLSISKALVEAHGGTIGVHSKGLGQGSTFWFTLPLIAAPHPRQGKA